MQHNKLAHDDLVIVDAHPQHYDAVLQALKQPVTLHTFATGQAALLSMPRIAKARWLVNVHLPDMAGVDLLQLIRKRRPNAAVSLVADVYSANDELAARSAGATAFLCKPAEANWIRHCRQRVAEPSLHAGPIRAPN